MLSLKNMTVSVDKKKVVQNLSLDIASGSIHAIMGQNGSGKSSLAHSLMGLPAYELTSGSVIFKGQDLVDISIQDRSKLGIFLAFQQPISIPGVTVFQFLKEIYSASGQQLSAQEFQDYVQQVCTQVGLDQSFLYRGLHDNFSGGEKKRLEIVQMLLLKPDLIILDEIDSGLDVDALRSIGTCITQYLQAHKNASCIVITHYRRILDYIEPTFVHIMYDGTIVHSGDVQLAEQVEQKGYDSYGR
ncbi:Fe-S cluster assembly ATPase SufC [Candidatus Babeliales bacterium]|nr:Fe-S cluster assembly ATPase SufC [Candidatus Babeliales bacterium]MBP9843776.1 Fe-S cluster assembly ATPase SufC [Candidatus Babeliales bacterium]